MCVFAFYICIKTVHCENMFLFAYMTEKCFLIGMQASTNTHTRPAHFDQMKAVTALDAIHLSSLINRPSSFISVSCFPFLPPTLEDNFTQTLAAEMKQKYLNICHVSEKGLSVIPAMKHSRGKDQKTLM